MVADAVIYHPTVSHYLKFVATTVGRDKLCGEDGEGCEEGLHFEVRGQ